MKIDTLVTSITELSDEDALHLILRRRQARREKPERQVRAPKKPKTQKQKKEKQPKLDPQVEVAMKLFLELQAKMKK